MASWSTWRARASAPSARTSLEQNWDSPALALRAYEGIAGLTSRRRPGELGVVASLRPGLCIVEWLVTSACQDLYMFVVSNNAPLLPYMSKCKQMQAFHYFIRFTTSADVITCKHARWS